jgi:hypothetical protein
MKETMRIMNCPKCAHVFGTVGSRLPNYCVECGKLIVDELREIPALVHFQGTVEITTGTAMTFREKIIQGTREKLRAKGLAK